MTTDPSTWEVEAGQSEIRGQLKRYLRPYLTRTKNTQTRRDSTAHAVLRHTGPLCSHTKPSVGQLDYAYSFPEDQTLIFYKLS